MYAGEVLVLFTFITNLLTVYCDSQMPSMNFNKPNTDKKLPPCQACKLFVSSFKKGMEKTARGKFEGGDAAWEEEKLGSYARSEVRLVEIQEKLCSDTKEYTNQCHAVAEISESIVEEWWFKNDPKIDDLHDFLCIEQLQHCCPEKHYGKDCKPCIGADDKVCSGNGKCKGDGTRKGNGQCVCDAGYFGEACTDCAVGYFEAYRDENKVLCSKCHKACKDGCTSGGVKSCLVCNDGWTMDTDNGCLDVDECLDQSQCKKDQFCVNDEGTFQCLACDKACDGCTGDGPDMCNKCGEGYKLKNKMCVESKGVDSVYVTLTRYITYLGLCITVGIIFQKSVWLAGLLGLLVAAYISIAEYMLANDLASPQPMIDSSSVDWASLLGKMT